MRQALSYRVYEGFSLPEREQFKFAVSVVREVSLRREIEAGERLLEIGELLHQVDSRVEALHLADDCEF